MSWNSIANNQCVSDTNLKDAVTTGIFAAGSTPFPSPTLNKEVTKSRCNDYIVVPNPENPVYANRKSNQLIIKSDIGTYGDFILDPQYGKQFKYTSYGITGQVGKTGVPSSSKFTWPVTSIQTVQYYTKIEAQNITLEEISGTSFTTVHVSLYVNSTLVDAKILNTTGSNYNVSLSLPFDVQPTDTVKIAIDSGPVPSPTTFTFGSNPVNNTAVSKQTGQYQIASIGTWAVNPPSFTRYAATSGYLCYSSDYGVNWYKSNVGGCFAKIAISHNGQYGLAVSQSGYAYMSSNYGATWNPLTSLGSRIWSGCACSDDGQYMIMTARWSSPYNSGALYVSSDYGVTWTLKTPSGATALQDYSSCTMGGYLGAAYMAATEYQYGQNTVLWFSSTNSGSTFTSQTFNVLPPASYSKYPIPSVHEIRMSPQGAEIFILLNNGGQTVALHENQSLSSFPSVIWDTMSNTVNGFYINCTVNSAYYNQVGILCFQGTTNSGGSADYLKQVSGFLNPSVTITDITAGGSRVWQCVDVDEWQNPNKYILAGTTSGLYRSNDAGATWFSL